MTTGLEWFLVCDKNHNDKLNIEKHFNIKRNTIYKKTPELEKKKLNLRQSEDIDSIHKQNWKKIIHQKSNI